jgi:hypothetical protein
VTESGLVVVDKPGGMTSHDVVSRVRRLAGTRKVGHAGTLDPMATRVLVLGIERATRLLGHLMLTEKAYDATVRLGVATTTDDAEGEPTSAASTSALEFRRNRLLERREHVVAWPESQGGIRYPHDVVAARDLDPQVRGHPRLQLQLGIGHVDDRRVGRDVLDDDRLQPNLLHRTLELLARVRVYCKRYGLVGPDAADIGFVDVGVDLHLGQVGRNHKERRRRHARGHRLPNIDASLDHDAVDRRGDDAVIEIDLRLAQAGL